MLYLFNTAPAQDLKAETEFLTWFFTKERKTTDSVLFLNDYDKGTNHQFKNNLKGDTIYDRFTSYPIKESIIYLLSEKERKYVEKELKETKSRNIPTKILPDMKIVKRKTIYAAFTKETDGWEELQKKNLLNFYSFKKPILLKDNTICIFEYTYNCGSLCSRGATNIYKKENGEWIPWKPLYRWIS